MLNNFPAVRVRINQGANYERIFLNSLQLCLVWILPQPDKTITPAIVTHRAAIKAVLDNYEYQ